MAWNDDADALAVSLMDAPFQSHSDTSREAVLILARRGATGERVPLLAGKRTGIPNGDAIQESPCETAESGVTSDDPARQDKKPIC